MRQSKVRTEQFTIKIIWRKYASFHNYHYTQYVRKANARHIQTHCKRFLSFKIVK